MKKILVKIIIGFLGISALFSNVYGFGVEEKTGDTSSVQLMGSYNLAEPKFFGYETRSNDIKNSFGFGLRATQGYEFFFTQKQGLRLYFDFNAMYYPESKFSDDGKSYSFLSGVKSVHYYDTKKSLWLDLGINLDYRIDFYQGKSSSYGAFAGIGYGYGTYVEEVTHSLSPNVASNKYSKTLLGGGVNAQAGILTTTKTGWQFELGVLYKYRDFYTYVSKGYLSEPVKKYFPISNLSAYLSIGRKY